MSNIPFHEIFFYSYFIISGILIIKIIFQLISILSMMKKHKGITRNKLVLYRLPLDNVSFSFFHLVFIGSTTEKEDLEKILAHEKVHADQWHTLDILIIEILCTILWFNPLLWWYRKEIKNVHEYLADDGALEMGFNRKSYQITLLEHLLGSASPSITNNFNYSLIKNRIAMMNKERTNRKNSWKAFILLPVSALIIIGFACTEKKAPDSIKSMPETEMDSSNEEVFYIVEEMPTFNGGDPAIEFRKYIGENLDYPEIAIKNGTTGKVIVQFAINNKGKVVDVTVVSGVDPALNAEAKRVVSSSPDWSPGRQKGTAVKVLFTFPINFELK